MRYDTYHRQRCRAPFIFPSENPRNPAGAGQRSVSDSARRTADDRSVEPAAARPEFGFGPAFWPEPETPSGCRGILIGLAVSVVFWLVLIALVVWGAPWPAIK